MTQFYLKCRRFLEVLPSRLGRAGGPAFSGAVLTAVLAACTTSGDISDPFTRRLTWFSYLSADDIEKACKPGTDARVRLVYTANRAKQVRIYNIDWRGDGTAVMKSGVLSGVVNEWGPWPKNGDLLSPFNPQGGTVVLDEARANRVKNGLITARFLGPPPKDGRRIASKSYFWLAGGCVDGRFHFQAWEHPDADFRRLRFPPVLFEAERSDIPVRYPPDDDIRRVNRIDGKGADGLPDTDPFPHYDLILHPDGVSQGRDYTNRHTF